MLTITPLLYYNIIDKWSMRRIINIMYLIQFIIAIIAKFSINKNC